MSADLRSEIEELRNGMEQKTADDEIAANNAAALDRLKREILDLNREIEDRDARETEMESDRRKLEYLKTETDMENEDLRRKLVGCENDVARLKVCFFVIALLLLVGAFAATTAMTTIQNRSDHNEVKKVIQ